MALDNFEDTEVVGVLTLVDAEDTLLLIDVEMQVLVLEYVEKTEVVGVLTCWCWLGGTGVYLVVLVLTDVKASVDLLELNEVDI